MIEIQQINERIAAEHYNDANSCFELRMMLMDAASLLTAKQISNLRQGRDPHVSMILLQAFRNVKQYYFLLEKTKDMDLACYNKTKDAVVAELDSLCQQLKGNVFQLPEENISALKIAQ
ncbi:hypothetical protein [[Flexibacter] sp. ATCC 35208]|uniref:hypothetical protein n=1 Tax=[Flexibacter] sp. ATCC 35208 TaxID=1936242 RepID=UPI0009D33EA7|nr:hypothetical protein [[Flexibacter] sp. ATCC 35208]OMP79147.1 hypothetical protein BW716_11040 [[Flexibacter] sp. ATCC 35208]